MNEKNPIRKEKIKCDICRKNYAFRICNKVAFCELCSQKELSKRSVRGYKTE